MTAALEEELRCIVEWGEKWLVSFNSTKTDSPECDTFRLGLVFIPKLDWKPYAQSVAKQALQRVWSLFRSQRYLTPETILFWAYGVVVSMFDFHRSDRGSNPDRGGKIS